MTTHTAITDYFAGATLDAGSMLCHRTTDATVKTASATGEISAGSAVYSAVFANVAAGKYRLKLLASGAVVATRDVEFAGTDAEVVETGYAVLDSAPDSPGVTTLLSRLTSGRAGNLDNLDVAVSVLQSQITALNNLSAKSNWFGSLLLEVPDSGTRAYVFELVVKDDEDKLVNLDASPTIALVNSAGTDRSSLITTSVANPATGRYTITITVGTGTVNESLKLTASGLVSGEARYAVIAPQVVDYDNATQIALLLTRVGIPSVSLSADVAAVSTKIGSPVVSVSSDIAAVKTDTDSLLTRITSGVTALISNLTAMITGTGGSAKFTTVAMSNVTGGSGGGGAPAVTLTLGATIPLTVGQVTGLTEDLVIGDSYTEEVGRRIPITLTDKDGNPVSTVFGNRSLADATCTIMCVLHPENSRNIDNVVAAAQGECEFVEETIDDPASLWLTLPKAQTERLNPGVYRVQVRATWDDGETVTLAWKGSCKFVRRITAKT